MAGSIIIGLVPNEKDMLCLLVEQVSGLFVAFALATIGYAAQRGERSETEKVVGRVMLDA